MNRANQKQEIIELYKEKFYNVAKDFKIKQSYAWFPKMELNNAVIMSFITYEQDYSLYEKLYEKEGKELRNLIKALQKIASEGGDHPKEYLKEYVKS